jgi:hypothetical protein
VKGIRCGRTRIAGWKWVTGFGALAAVSFALTGFTGWRWPVLVGMLACGCVQAALAYSFQNRGP